MKNNNKKGFTIVEVLVSFVLIMIVVIYLLRTIIVTSNKNNQLLTMQEFTVYEDTLLTDVYKDIDIVYNLQNFHQLTTTGNSITLPDINKSISIDPTKNQINYGDKIYQLPNNVTLRQKDGKYYDVSDPSGLRPYQTIKIYVKVNDKNDDIKIVYQNKSLRDMTVKFDPSGGTFTSCSSPYSIDSSYCKVTGKNKQIINSVPVVSRESYEFEGWFTEKTGGSKLTDKKITITSDLTYYAHWKEKQYPIVYDLKGGIGNGNVDCSEENNDCRLQEASAGLDAYRLVCYGAIDSYNCKEVHNQIPCTNEEFGDPIFGTKKSCYEIFYPMRMTVSSEPNVLKTIYNPSRVGYTFSYWTINGAGSSSLTRDLQNNYSYFSIGTGATAWSLMKNTMVSTGKFNVVANWTANNYTLTLNPNGGTYNGTTGNTTKTMTYNSSNNNSIGVATKGTDIFLGWYTAAQGGTQVYNASGQNVAATDFWSAAYSTGVWKKAENVTLYAHYQSNGCYSISYNLNGGSLASGKSNPSNYCQNSNAITLNNPSKTGYTFNGWSGTGLTGTANKSVTIAQGSTGNRSYTANYNPCTYYVKFNGNGNTGGSMANETFTYGTAKALTANAFTKTGHAFDGWALTATGAKAYNNSQSVSNLTSACSGTANTVNLYARWKKNTYTITYRCNGETSATQTCEYGSTVSTSGKTCSPAGYHLVNWTLNGNAVTSFTCDGNKTIQASITTNIYHIKYHGNTGNGDKYKELLKAGHYKSLPKPGGEFSNNTFYHYKDFSCNWSETLATNYFKKSGYTFIGWNTKADGSGTKFKDKATVVNLSTTNNGIVNLYAQWKPKDLFVGSKAQTLVCTEKTSVYYASSTASNCPSSNQVAASNCGPGVYNNNSNLCCKYTSTYNDCYYK